MSENLKELKRVGKKSERTTEFTSFVDTMRNP